jgi:two-component system, OmpR family, sensor kinase
MSIRLRLTLWYSAVLGLALVAFCAFLYGILSYTFLKAVDADLQARAASVALFYRTYRRLPELERLADANTFIQVTDGNVVVKSNNLLRPLPLPPEAAEASDGLLRTYPEARGGRVRLYTRPFFTAQGNLFFYVQVAQTLNQLDAVLALLPRPLAFGVALFLGGAALAGWWLARAAMAPIERISRTAHAVGESGDLSQRVEYAGPEDEVGLLAATFNRMLVQLETAYARLEEAVEAQKRFVADASHELRTPLTIIRGNIELLQRMGEADPTERDSALADIRTEAERMSRLVEDLLMMARADAGQRPELIATPLGPLVREACRRAQALPHQAEFTADLPEALDRLQIWADPDSLTRTLLILIDNAFKYTPAGGKVTVRAGRQGDGVAVQVSDTGIGIAPEDLPHVFERFYRADRARTRGGTGLGLAIARWVTSIHGGRLSVDSEVNRGSLFTLWLPLPQS